MANNLEKKSNGEKVKINGFVNVHCGQTTELLLIPREVYQRVQQKDKSIANKEFATFYVSPGFSFYKSYDDFNMFCED